MIADLFSLEGKRALVTGCKKGHWACNGGGVS